MNHDNNCTNILSDIEQEIYLEQASVGVRFVNYLIDLLFFYGIIIIRVLA